MTEQERPPEAPQECPGQMPVSYFGANYQDSQCNDGYLWDLDSGDGEYLTSGGDIPCPFCKPEQHAEYKKIDDEDQFVCEVCSTQLSALHWAETDKGSVKLYGHCASCNCNQWASYKAHEESEDD